MNENTFINNLANQSNYTHTANGAWAHKSSMNALLDLFALGGAYRQRSDEDVIFLFKKAFDEDETYAMKCLFYLRDVRGGGQGERRFFRVCMRWLAKNRLDAVIRNLDNMPEYGRYDDWFELLDTPAKEEVLKRVKAQLVADMQTEYPSLLAKWMPSLNCSSSKTIRRAHIIRNYLGWTQKQYRKTLSILRKRINVLECLMSANRWQDIEFDKIPSKAGLQYRKAFERHDIERKKANPQAVTYEEFAKDTNTKVNAKLYPYDVVDKAIHCRGNIDDTERLMINKYWKNLPDYLNGIDCKMLCVCDTSGSMTWGSGPSTPINVAIGLSMYCAEHIGGPFKGYYISFASRPQFIKIDGVDFVDKVHRIYRTNLCDNTNLTATFDLLLETALKSNKEDIPTTLCILSDMNIDEATRRCSDPQHNGVKTEMELVRAKWASYGLVCPKLVYWNINASKDLILELGPNIQYCSGASASLFEQIIRSKDAMTLMMEVLNNERYSAVS